MNPNKMFSGTVGFNNYAKFNSILGRRETLEETINRNMQMHLDRFPKLSGDITKAYTRIHDLKVMPSMRSMQFGGEAILKNNARLFNCSYAPIDNTKVFSEALFLLLSGVGFGFSVQSRHVSKLPKLQTPRENGTYVIHDSIQGWAEALNVLLEAYFFAKIRPEFDYSSIRPKGAYLVTTGAKAPGPLPLRTMLNQVEEKLKLAVGRKLTPIEVHDLVCIASDAVLAGGIRRAALISLFDKDDEEMLKCKHGNWWEKHPYRARANNSAVLDRNNTTKEEFDHVFDMCKQSGSGEPGFYWSSNLDWGSNPCVTGDTEILTKDGYKRIDETVDTPVEVWNGFEWSEVTPKITGRNQELVTISFNDGRTLTCTLYHKFHIAEGYKGKHDVLEAKDLQIGMKLIKHELPVIEHGPELEHAYTQGFVAAEGMELNRTLYVYQPKEMCLYRLEGIKKSNKEETHNRYRLTLEKIPMSKNFVPLDYNLKSKLDWLSGLFDGDGTELKEGSLQICSVNLSFLKEVQKLLSTVGVQCKLTPGMKAGVRSMPNHKDGNSDYYCQESFRICIGATQMQGLKRLGLKCERLSFDKEPQRDASQFVTITNIVEAGIADTVYCFNEPKRHLGLFNGVLTGQCVEIALQPNQFCNLTTVNQTGIKDKKDFMNRIYAATLVGTLQATYTDFQYLRPRWREITEQDALLGVSFTGIADGNGIVTNEWLKEGAAFAKEINQKYAKKLGINSAARITAIKPEGTASCILGSSSGIHARHAEYYIRRIRLGKDSALTKHLLANTPELLEEDLFNSTGMVLSIPQHSPSNSIIRHNDTLESSFQRTMDYNINWVAEGHITGDNKHNVSVTLSVKDNEWETLRELMWENRYNYSGISLLPFDGGTYQQAPFEDCTKEKYDELCSYVKDIDFTKIKEEDDNTTRMESLACAGGLCEIT